MAKQRYVYRHDKEGKIRRMELTERVEYFPDETVDNFDLRMRKTFHQQECEQGSRFNVPGFTKKQLQQAWPAHAET